MATYTLISKSILSSNTATITFNNIPSIYTDLVLTGTARTDSTGDVVRAFMIKLNSSTTDYSSRNIYATGTGVGSSTNYVGRGLAFATTASATSNTFASFEIYLPNYAGSTNKSWSATSVTENNATESHMLMLAGQWAQTGAISRIDLDVYLSSNFVSGSSFYLYGITKA